MSARKVESAVSVRARPLHGRDSELARVMALVTEGERVTLTGLPGVGKTALLNSAIRALRAQFEVQWLVPGAPLPQRGTGRLLVADVSRADAVEVPALTAAVEGWAGPALVAASTALGVSAERVVTLLGLGAPANVDGLEGHPAAALWLEHVRDSAGDGYALPPSERGALKSLLEQVDGLPAAVVISAELFSALSLTEQLEQLRTDDDPLGLRLSKLFVAAWKVLSNDQQAIMLSALVMSGTSLAEVRSQLGAGASEDLLALQQRGLLRRGKAERLQLPPPVALSMRHLAGSEALAQASEAYGRRLLERLKQALIPTGALEGARAALEGLLSEPDLVPQLRFDALLALADTTNKLGDPETALDCTEQAHRLAVTAQHPTWVARTLIQTAAVFTQLGDPAGAMTHAERAVQAAQEADPHVQLEAGVVLASALHVGQSLENARGHYEQQARRAAEFGERAVEARCMAYRAFAATELGHFAEALVELRDAVALLEAAGDSRYAGFTRAVLGLISAAEGHVDIGETLVAKAARALDKSDDPFLTTAVKLCGMAVRARAAGEGPERTARLAELGALLRECKNPDAETRAPTARSLELRRLVAYLDATLLPDSAARAVLLLGPAYSWMSMGGEPRLDLQRRTTARRLLQCLVETQQRAPGAAAASAALVAAAWPEQRVINDSSINRLRVAIFRLRQLGLGERVQYASDGYLLDPSVEIRHDDSPADSQ